MHPVSSSLGFQVWIFVDCIANSCVFVYDWLRVYVCYGWSDGPLAFLSAFFLLLLRSLTFSYVLFSFPFLSFLVFLFFFISPLLFPSSLHAKSMIYA